MAKLKQLAELRRLRAAGKTQRSLEFDEEEGKIYDEYDQKEYEAQQRRRLREDNFVVDDDGRGYIDNGEYEWGQPHSYGSSESEGGDQAVEEEARSRRDGDLTSMLSAPKRPKLARSVKPVSSIDVDAIVNSLGSSKPKRSLNTSPHNSVVRKPLPNSGFRAGLGSGLGSGIRSGILSGLGSRLKRSCVDATDTPTRNPSSKNRVLNEPEVAEAGDSSMLGSSVIGPKQETYFAPISLEAAAAPISEPLSDPPLPHTAEESINLSVAQIMELCSDSEDFVPGNASAADLPTPGPSSEGNDSASGTFSSVEWNLVPETDASSNSSTTAVRKGSTLRLFWTDYLEQGGGLVLFGKTVKGEGAAVVLRGIDLDLYLLPRPGKTTENVAEEMSVFFSRNGVSSLRTMSTTLKDCFAKDKSEHEYLRVKAPYVREPVPREGSTYSKCNGATVTPIESFVINKKIMGPCWLDVKVKETANNVSWTGTSVECASPAHVTVVPEAESSRLGVPKFTMMSLAITTIPNAQQNHEVVSISVRLFRNADDSSHNGTELPSSLITGIRPPESGGFPIGFKAAVKEHNDARSKSHHSQSQVLITHTSEKALLGWFFSMLLRVDPDILIGHSLTNVHLATLLSRALATNETGWSKLGRFRQHSQIRKAGMQEVQRVCSGRLLVDLKNTFGMEIASRKCRDFTLEEMCREFLGQHRQAFDTNLRSGDWLARGSEGLIDVVRRSEHDTLYVASIALKNQMLPLSRQLTQLAGNTWRATLFGTRSGRNDYLLMHEFFKNGYLIPDKPVNTAFNPGKHENQFAGGQVFEPVAGLHQSCVLVMDFNSLYPSIIQEYNICFTTVDYEADQTTEPEVPDASVPQGLLPKLLQNLVRRRQEVKKLMKSPTATAAQQAEWDIRQMALKLTANSMYGCLGLAESRFGARPLAQLVTMKGRQILVRTKELAESNGMRVLYGDTDSVMIHTSASKYADAYAIGVEFKRLVNQQYKMVEIDIDHVFRHLLLYMKKKYAAVILQPDGELTLEYKGLDLRRREFSDVCKISSKQVLNLLFGLSGKNDFNTADSKDGSKAEQIDEIKDPLEIFERVYEYLANFAKDVRDGKLFPKMFVIRNQLSRDLDKYGKLDKPQLLVAQARMKAGFAVKSKDVISYIIAKCNVDGDASKSVAERGVSFEDLKTHQLCPDYEWYLHHQVFTPISRFCDKIEGFDAERLADMMGLPFHESVIKGSNVTRSGNGSLFGCFEGARLITQGSDADRFASCEPLKLRHGEHEFEFKGLSALEPQGVTVPNSDVVVTYESVALQVDRAIRKCIARYYNGWMECDECKCLSPSVCTFSAKRCPQHMCNGTLVVVYTSKELYTQMCYFRSLFDISRVSTISDKRVTAAVNSPRNSAGLNMVFDLVSKYIRRSGYSHIKLGQYFVFGR